MVAVTIQKDLITVTVRKGGPVKTVIKVGKRGIGSVFSQCVFILIILLNSYTFIYYNFLDVNECEDEALCQNNGTCSNTEGSYVCSCVEGWQGHNCETGA